MSTETKSVVVKLTSIPGTKKGSKKAEGKPKTKEFPIDQANKLLKMKKSAWKLDDKDFKFNGTEIAKASK